MSKRAAAHTVAKEEFKHTDETVIPDSEQAAQNAVDYSAHSHKISEEQAAQNAIDFAAHSSKVSDDKTSKEPNGRHSDAGNSEASHTEASHTEARADPISHFEDQVLRLAEELDSLGKRLRPQTASSGPRLAPRAEEVVKQVEDLRRRVGDLRTNSSDAWEEIKLGFELAWKDLSDAFESVRHRFTANGKLDKSISSSDHESMPTDISHEVLKKGHKSHESTQTSSTA